MRNYSIGLATKCLRILSLGGIDKIRDHLVANPIFTTFYCTSGQFQKLVCRGYAIFRM